MCMCTLWLQTKCYIVIIAAEQTSSSVCDHLFFMDLKFTHGIISGIGNDGYANFKIIIDIDEFTSSLHFDF